MNISIIGAGYVGLITGTCFAELGNNITLVDIIPEKIEKINKGISPIYEQGLEDLLKKNLDKIKATNKYEEAILNSDITFIAVGTPSNEDGSINLDYIKQASRNIGNILKNKSEYHVVVVKSTVLSETTEKVIIPEIEKKSGKKAGIDFGVCVNPEFLKEGKAIEDFMNPDRIVIGALDEQSSKVLESIYNDFKCPILKTDLKTAEMIKYAANAFLAAKISLINEIGNICKKMNIDTYEVAKGIGYDERIGNKFLNSGIGFGGSCFPKDVKALISKAKKIGYEPKILDAVIETNKHQPAMLLKILKKYLPNLKGKTIAILGLAFKPDTDDIREAPAIKIVDKLLKEESIVKAYDPIAIDNFKQLFPNVIYCKNFEETIKNSDACLFLTEWDEFKKLNNTDFNLMKQKIIIEGRKILDKKKIKNFEGICW